MNINKFIVHIDTLFQKLKNTWKYWSLIYTLNQLIMEKVQKVEII